MAHIFIVHASFSQMVVYCVLHNKHLTNNFQIDGSKCRNCIKQASNYIKIKFFSWNEWIEFPLKFSELPRDALLGFTIWDTIGPERAIVIGGTAISIFGKRGAMRQGLHDLRVWLNRDSNDLAKDGLNGKCDRSEQSIKMGKVNVK